MLLMKTVRTGSLSLATQPVFSLSKVMEAEQTKTRSELVHKETAAKYNAAMGRMKQLEKKLKRAINKSKYVLRLERSSVVRGVCGRQTATPGGFPGGRDWAASALLSARGGLATEPVPLFVLPAAVLLGVF